MTTRMTRFSKNFLLLGTAILALNACSTKGPGDIGSKDDIIVHNQGQPAPQQAAKAEGEDFSSTVEQAEAHPVAEVASAEPLPDTSPAMEEAVAQHEAAQAPIAPDAASPADKASAPPSETRPLDAVAPTTPVTQAVTPPPANAPVTATSPAAPAPTPTPTVTAAAPVYPAPTPAPAPVAAPVAAPAVAAKYPLDPNAPYSPKAVAAANAAAGIAPAAPVATTPAAPTTTTTTATPVPAGAAVNFSDPSIIRSAQAALKQKGLYKGAESGTIDTEFLNALTIYQTGNSLPVGGINEPTLRYLGVIE